MGQHYYLLHVRSAYAQQTQASRYNTKKRIDSDYFRSYKTSGCGREEHGRALSDARNCGVLSRLFTYLCWSVYVVDVDDGFYCSLHLKERPPNSSTSNKRAPA